MKSDRPIHVTESDIERLVQGELEESEVRRIILHLSRCRGCRQGPHLPWLGAVLSGAEASPAPLDPEAEAAYDRAIDRALTKVF